MDCQKIMFSGHAIQRMYESSILPSDVRQVVSEGEIIHEYTDDKPLPSFLLLGIINNISLHVLLGVDTDSKDCMIITAYRPDPTIWDNNFKNRR